MQGPIAQIIALTTFGNAFLSGWPKFEASAFYPANSTFKFCEHVRFVNLMHEGIVSKETEFADNPYTWFGHLKRDGVNALRMVYRSTDGQTFGDKTITDRMLVGFAGGGGSWLMEAISPSGSDFWEGRWEVGDRERKDQRIWRVKYGRVATNRPTVHRPTTDISALKNKLADNLESIGSFARVQNLNAFAKAFGGGLANLRSQDPCNSVHHSDLSPELRPGGSYGNT